MSREPEASRILTKRLELVLLGRTFLADIVSGNPGSDLAFTDPAGFMAGAEDVARLRLKQLDANPDIAPWLLRAIVVRETRVAVGFIGFHDAPDDCGMAEIGYEVLPSFRRRGYAFEAVSALTRWAGRHGVMRVRACVSPENGASMALLARQGFAVVGEQIDEEDGRELVLERAVDVCAT
jgi:[ribosomal protein S5]-alanine N-acetyltransferase